MINKNKIFLFFYKNKSEKLLFTTFEKVRDKVKGCTHFIAPHDVHFEKMLIL